MPGRGFWLILLVLLTSGCGYSFQGGVNTLVGDVRKLAIPMVENSTTYTVLTNSLTNQLISEFTLSKFVRVTGPGMADATLQARVNSVRIVAAAQAVDQEISYARRVIVDVGATLKTKQDGRVLWQRKSIEARRTYPVSDDQSIVEANLTAALKQIAQEIAVKIHDSVFEGF